MFYYTIRFILLFILLLVLKKFGKPFFKKYYKITEKYKKKKLINILASLCVTIICVAIISYPYEGYFIRFKTLENSLKYSVFQYYSMNNTYIQDENTHFIICKRGNNHYYHSVNSYDNGYGLCDFKTRTDIMNKQAYFKLNEHYVVLNLTTIYNQISDKTCYFIDAISISENENIEIFDSNGKVLNQVSFENENSSNYYYKVSNGKPEKNFTVVINGENYILS